MTTPESAEQMRAASFKFRLKDKHDAELSRQARTVNYIWNFCQDTQKNAMRWGKKWPTGYQLQKLCAGSSEELGLLSSAIDMVCQQYAARRRQANRSTLRWRGRKSLGWVPVRDGAVRFDATGFMYRGKRLDAWITRDMDPGQRFGCGTLSQDSRGRWYINLVAEIAPLASAGTTSLGIDLVNGFRAWTDIHRSGYVKGWNECLAACKCATPPTPAAAQPEPSK